jgi:transcription termination factor Rho
MSADKFLSKSKDDLVLLATLGNLMTRDQAQKMTRNELARYLQQEDEKAGTPVLSKRELNRMRFMQELAEGKVANVPVAESQKTPSSHEEQSDGEEKKSASSTRSRRRSKTLPVSSDSEKLEDSVVSKDTAVSADSPEPPEIRLKAESSRRPRTSRQSHPRQEKKIISFVPSKTDNLKANIKNLPEELKEHLILGSEKGTEDARHGAREEGKSDSPADTDKKIAAVPPVELAEMTEGILEVMSDGYGFLRKDNYLQSSRDIYVPPQYIRKFNLRTGDKISGPGKMQKENDRYQAIMYIKEVNGKPPEVSFKRLKFDRLTPIYPDERFVLETTRNELSTRIIDLVAPIGKGQRGMIVSPPKAGKTILLQKIANAIATNNPQTKLIVLLIDERPEEVTDMQRSIRGEVVYSTFDKTPENHVRIVELVLERAMRLVELGEDVVILLDSITRLGRAYNLTINPTGRTLSGGLDPGALYGPKRFFGAARNIEGGGSLTIVATALIDTGSRMDEVIFEEFKGTGNMEVYLDRKLSEKRIFPAIDINRSGTRREELLLDQRELDAVWTIRKAFGQLDTSAVTEMIINLLLKTTNNNHFVSSVNVSLNDKTLYEAMRGGKSGGNGQSHSNNGYNTGYNG